MDAELQEYYELIVENLKRYGNLEEIEARRLIDKSELFQIHTDLERAYLFHEIPYYWAMDLLSSDPDWYLNPKLWPPPEDAP